MNFKNELRQEIGYLIIHNEKTTRQKFFVPEKMSQRRIELTPKSFFLLPKTAKGYDFFRAKSCSIVCLVKLINFARLNHLKS